MDLQGIKLATLTPGQGTKSSRPANDNRGLTRSNRSICSSRLRNITGKFADLNLLNFLDRGCGILLRFFTDEAVVVLCRYFVCDFRVQASVGGSNDANATVIIPQLTWAGPVIDGD